MNPVTAARRTAGFTQAELAAAVGVTQQTVSLWEHGGTRPQPEHVEQLERLLGVRSGSLFPPEQPGPVVADPQ